MAKKKLAFTEKVKKKLSKAYNEKGIEKTSTPQAEAHDKYEEIAGEFQNEDKVEEQMDDEDLDLATEEKKNFDEEEVDEREQAIENKKK